jgi:NAD(P)H-flavin reductase
MGVGHGKVLILSPDYKGKRHMESISSNLASRMELYWPPKICGPPGMMEFNNNDTKEEKDDASNELVVTLKQRIIVRSMSRSYT